MKILLQRLSAYKSPCCNLFTSSPYTYFPLPLSFLHFFASFQQDNYWQIEWGRINHHSVSAGFFFLLQTNTFGLGRQQTRQIEEDSGMEEGRVRSEVDRREMYLSPSETKTDCTLLSARMSILSGLLAFPTCLSTILASHHTNILKNCTPRTLFS